MKKFLYLAGTLVLMLGVYRFARFGMVKSPFTVMKTDSVGVYRIFDTQHYITVDKTQKVTLTYIQLGEDDSFFQLKLFNCDEPYYGSIYFDENGAEYGTFSSAQDTIPVIFFTDKDFHAHIIINNDTIALE